MLGGVVLILKVLGQGGFGEKGLGERGLLLRGLILRVFGERGFMRVFEEKGFMGIGMKGVGLGEELLVHLGIGLEGFALGLMVPFWEGVCKGGVWGAG